MRASHLCLVLCVSCACAMAATSNPLEPFAPDAHTMLLYHFDEGAGTTAADASGHGATGTLQGPRWVVGKFGKALAFDGVDDSVFCATTKAITGLKQITVECWYRHDDPSGRQFLVGKDAGFHFDLSGGLGTSMSLYNHGASVANAQGLRHQHLGTRLRAVRIGRWHHLATTYDGHHLSFFLDGVLQNRQAAARDFAIGVASRGLWVGCYVGREFWYSGVIDEVRVSNCVRYDPDKKLSTGERAFDMPTKGFPRKAVRKPRTTGRATLRLTCKKLYGGNASGWVYLKPPAAKAAIVGRYALKDLDDGATADVSLDVSDEVAAAGCHILALENTQGNATFAVAAASLVAGGKTLAKWAGEARSHRTFRPPVLVPLTVGKPSRSPKPEPLVLLPTAIDRVTGGLAIDDETDPTTPCLYGEGHAEWWLHVPAKTTYRVWLRYAARAPRPCDIVIDGDDLHPFNMGALNRTDSAHPTGALWERQGIVTLAKGPHWIRLQDILPDTVALRLEPIAQVSPPQVPWGRFPVPDGRFLAGAATWHAESLFGTPTDASLTADAGHGQLALRFAATFANTDKNQLWAADAVRFICHGAWDLEPFGRLAFTFEGKGSGHVVALWAIDAKGDEALLWRARDTQPGPLEVAVPISFEGHSIFDPARVVAMAIDLDEANTRAAQVNTFAGAIVEPAFELRDVLAPPRGHAARLAKARAAIATLDAPKATPLVAPRFTPWTQPVVPETHPLFATTTPKPVTRKTLGYTLHATGARNISERTLDDYHKHYNFGDVTWPHIGIFPLRSRYKSDEAYRAALKELERRLIDVRDRGLFVFDIWGYVPYHPSFPHTIKPEHHEIIMRVMGDRFTGYDDGEHDGRYIGSYSGRGTFTTRKGGYADFCKWDDHIFADSMGYMNATGSLNYSHYYGERGCRMLGLETAQGLPSDTLLFAFLRGAGKQYGRLIYQATSVWSRFGYNMYHSRKTTGPRNAFTGYGYGPNKGCSRSLHKRLFFCGYLGGHSVFGTETAQFTADRLANGAPELSPLGRQHLDLMAWARKHPDRGVMHTPVAFMLDFYNGWNMPRHLYRGDKYKIWGRLPYEKGDYLTDAIFRMVWPGYEDASYLRNERGFVCPTPYGDSFDVLNNRCHPDVLKQYAAVILLNDVEMSAKVAKTLTDYVRQGGDLVLSARNAHALPAGLCGVAFGPQAKATASRSLTTGNTFDEQPYTYTRLTLKGATALLVNEHGHPLITVHALGKGRIIVGAADHWMTDPVSYRDPDLVNMEPPYRLLHGVRAVLDAYFDSFNPVEITPGGLTIRTCLYPDDPKRMLVGLINNDLSADWRGALGMRIGRIRSVRELWRKRPVALRRGRATLTVPAGDVAILDVRLK